MTSEDRAVVGVIVLLVVIIAAAVYLLAASSVFGALEDSPLTNDDDFQDDRFGNGTKDFTTMKDMGLIYGPLIWMAGGVVFALGWYIRKERSGGRRPPP